MTTHNRWLKKLDQLKQRAQTHVIGVVPIIEVLT